MKFSSIFSDLANSSHLNAAKAQLGHVESIKSKIPGGLASGAVAGGVAALLMGNKSLRKHAGTAAKYGGAAVLGGLAYKAYKSWAQGSDTAHRPRNFNLEVESQMSHQFQLALIKAMIAAARADGSIDALEQMRISEAIEKLELDDSGKQELLNLFIYPISIRDFIHDVTTLEQKSEIYLASCLAIDLDHDAEYAYLNELARALALPSGLEHQLRTQASNAQLEQA